LTGYFRHNLIRERDNTDIALRLMSAVYFFRRENRFRIDVKGICDHFSSPQLYYLIKNNSMNFCFLQLPLRGRWGKKRQNHAGEPMYRLSRFFYNYYVASEFL
jgi:hypothetical protein